MKPEDLYADKKRPFMGKEFLNSLQDGREIYIYGERVKDVTTHPAFRNSAASVAEQYESLHIPENRDTLCWDTDTGNGGYTHKFFRFATNPNEFLQQRDAIVEWARLNYGWMGRSPDFEAAFCCSLGAYPEYYGQFADNARHWYQRTQESCLFLNHAIGNPPIDRHKPIDQIKDVFMRVEKETDAGIIVSGAKVVTTNAALTNFSVVGFAPTQALGDDPSFALVFVAPMDAEGLKLISRTSYEFVASAIGSPFDYPLSSRFDENDAILILDNVLIPWENVLVYRDFERAKNWMAQSGFAGLSSLQSCSRLCVKLDFITGLLQKSLECTGVVNFRGVQADLGEVVAWRNLCWSLASAMCSESKPWQGSAYQLDMQSVHAYRVMAPIAYTKIKNIIEYNVASGLIYLPSSVRDINNPTINQHLEKYVCGSNGMGHIERIKVLKLMWDAIGSEFGGRHELYEINYAGNQDELRLNCLRHAYGSGNMKKMTELVDRCLSEYDVNGWTVPHLHNNHDINVFDTLLK
ncbi:4-hydroxyphenylacetate 3-monooxygenase [Xenorhabdus cabanillasii]|uniref:4-hydroxyphenylacetate 3-monooxygenase, oxygenase component n=1 Tax=Xenorhabdus cabanillasii TaxID=351673 RepID=A0A3D9UTB7_9GAMM|nr:4-hydroxyphenylacetate 3-monooxygenase, oxygenase component [Xenorhabdus cabanillasii]REF27961.1 4-hydroxyphenylacetate 3-monooxygenase [Xenorhabdus cabanillasii]